MKGLRYSKPIPNKQKENEMKYEIYVATDKQDGAESFSG
ncbi:hypothetical protein [Enterobacter phage N5822]|nr:hypothetical protein [Enterobacter phage N5822]